MITLDFQTGKYTVTPYSSTVPDNLYIIGDATPAGWGNPVPVPQQQFTKLTSTDFEITLPLNSGGQYLLLPQNGSWAHKYASPDPSVDSAAYHGAFKADDGANFPAPAASASYKMRVSFINNQYVLVKQ